MGGKGSGRSTGGKPKRDIQIRVTEFEEEFIKLFRQRQFVKDVMPSLKDIGEYIQDYWEKEIEEYKNERPLSWRQMASINAVNGYKLTKLCDLYMEYYGKLPKYLSRYEEDE